MILKIKQAEDFLGRKLTQKEMVLVQHFYDENRFEMYTDEDGILCLRKK